MKRDFWIPAEDYAIRVLEVRRLVNQLAFDCGFGVSDIPRAWEMIVNDAFSGKTVLDGDKAVDIKAYREHVRIVV